MEFTVKGIKGFRGTDGHGFNATLYADDKRVALVMDEANGGEYRYEWDGKTNAERAANEKLFKDFIAALPPEPLEDDAEEWEKTLSPDVLCRLNMDQFIGRLVDNAENEKRLSRHRKTLVLYVLPDQKPNTMTTCKHNGDPEKMKALLLKKHPGIKFL